MGKTGGLLFVVVMILSACAMPPAALPPSPEEAALLDDFQRAAYGAVRPVLGNDGQTRSRRDHLAKWQIPIRVGLVGEDGANNSDGIHRAAVERHIATLSLLTGLDIAIVAPEQANLLIFFAEDPFEAARRHSALYRHRVIDPRAFNALLAQMEETATCFGLLWGGWPSGRSVDFSVVFIRTGRGERTIQGCLVQETTQILGLLHDLDPESDSVFSDSGRQIELTVRDRLLLQLLYDPRLKPGMGWAEVEPLALARLREMQAGGSGLGG